MREKIIRLARLYKLFFILGSGKSSTIELLRNRACKVVPECVDLFRNVDGVNFLELIYKNPEEHMLSFELFACFQRFLSQDRFFDTLIGTQAPVTIWDRSMLSTLIFLESAASYNFKVGSEEPVISTEGAKFFRAVHGYFSGQLLRNIDLYIYLDVDTRVATQRVQDRGRGEEIGITWEYQECLRLAHESILFNSGLDIDVVRIRVDEDTTEDEVSNIVWDRIVNHFDM